MPRCSPATASSFSKVQTPDVDPDGEDRDMGIRTGRQYLDSLRDGRQMWIDGELIADVTSDRRFAAAARTMAELYDM